MMQINELLELRNKIKSRKPDFIRQDTHKRKRLSLKWRKPKGIHSKIRHHFKGRRKMPSPGYKSPIRVKGLHTSGLRIINISSLKDLQEINRESEGVVISKNVGMKKKLEILKKVKHLNIVVFNLNVDEQIKKIEDLLNSKKKTKEPKKEIKEVKKEVRKDEIKEISDEQKKEAEKKEKDRILTKKV